MVKVKVKMSGKPKDYHFRRFDPLGDMDLVLRYHKEHVEVNFPGTLYKPKLFREQLKNGLIHERDGMLMLVHFSGEQVGFVWLTTEFDEYAEIYFGKIRYIHIDPEHRRKGFGTMMMKKAKDYFSGTQAHELRLAAYLGNDAAIGLAKTSGFEPKRLELVRKI